MTNYYFEKFPTLYYNNLQCRDITRRVRLNPIVKDNINLYYPIEIKAGFRPDSLSAAYYDDSTLDWLIYLANDIMDPYYDWYLSENNFNDFLTKKYGTVATSQSKIKYYQNNWYADSSEISPDFYNYTLSKSYRKYYKPVYGAGNKIMSYTRKEQDWIVATNRILEFTISLSDANTQFVESELVDIKSSGEIVGGGEVIESNSSVLIIKHVSGNTSANTTSPKTIIGQTSGANGTANAVFTKAESFDETEAVYWSSVSYYDWEYEQNENNKLMEVVDSKSVFDITTEIETKLQDN